MSKSITIVMADDQELYRDGVSMMLRQIPDVKIIAETRTGRELIQVVEQLQPDIVLTDIKLPEIDGIAATKELRKCKPLLGILALSFFDEVNYITAMIEAGANGYILKNASKREIIEGINAVYNGKQYYCNGTAIKLAQAVAINSIKGNLNGKSPSFSERELKIIELICKEKTNKEIAGELFLSPRTVETWRLTIEEKMHARNAAGVVIHAIKMGIYKIPGEANFR